MRPKPRVYKYRDKWAVSWYFGFQVLFSKWNNAIRHALEN